METKVSLDNITVVGVIHDELYLVKKLNKWAYVKTNGFANYPWKHNFKMVDGSFLQIAEHNVQPSIRLEFNPNKCMKECIGELMSFIIDKRITRVDVAIDYYGIDIADHLWFPDRKRKRKIFYGRDGKLETVYFGSRESEKMIRIYDKAREEKAEGLWTRVEMQRRYREGDSVLEESLFGGIEGYKTEFMNINIPVKDRGIICLLYYHPGEWDRFSRGIRQRFEQKRRNFLQALSPMPETLYIKERGRLMQEVDYWLKIDLWLEIGHYRA